MSETTLRLDRPLKMVTICLGQMQTNCYIVENTKTNQAFVFDPGDQGRTYYEYIRRRWNGTGRRMSDTWAF